MKKCFLALTVGVLLLTSINSVAFAGPREHDYYGGRVGLNQGNTPAELPKLSHTTIIAFDDPSVEVQSPRNFTFQKGQTSLEAGLAAAGACPTFAKPLDVYQGYNF
jgi:hypothetical protein